MPMLTSLPCEVVAVILRNLDNVRSLVPALLSCRHIYSSFKESPGSIRLSILRHQVTPALLPYSVAVMEAWRQPAPPPLASINALLDTLYNEPSQLTSRLHSLPADIVRRMGRMHDIVHSLVNDFAADAWSLLSRGSPGVSDAVLGSLSLSPTEYFRFCCVFYHFELFVTLFRCPGLGADEMNDKDHFFSRLAPWEIEQLGCVHDFLEKRFLQASLDVLEHDVHFGEFSVDYLTLGEDNFALQRWLSQGLEYIDQVLKEVSYDKKKALLETAYMTSQVEIHEVQIHESLGRALDDVNLDDIQPLGDYTEDEMEASIPGHALRNADVDRGPRMVWGTIHKELSFADSVMLDEAAGLREQGYVMWDLGRIQRYDMLRIFDRASTLPSHSREYNRKAFTEMTESFQERSLIWQRGGSGYWSKGDESRILWPGGEKRPDDTGSK